MTDEEIERLIQLERDATPGPWNTEPDRDDPKRVAGIWVGDDRWNEIVKTDCGVYPPELPDALFICAARTAVPALFAKIREQREIIERQAATLRATGGMNESRRVEILRLHQVIAKLKGEPLPPTGG